MARGRPAGANGPSPRRSRRQASPGAEDRDRIIDAALACIARQGWRRLSLADIAAEAGLPILRVYRLFLSKTAILCGFVRSIDEAVLAAPLDVEPGERPRDRIFDLLMRRFDALRPYRVAMEALSRDLPADPVAALGVGAALLRSIRWMLEAAGVSGGGIGGAIAVQLTAGAYLATLRTWLRDDSPDLAPTMATLDRRLRGTERWYGGGRRGDRAQTTSS